jgi:hypothetical protein
MNTKTHWTLIKTTSLLILTLQMTLLSKSWAREYKVTESSIDSNRDAAHDRIIDSRANYLWVNELRMPSSEEYQLDSLINGESQNTYNTTLNTKLGNTDVAAARAEKANAKNTIESSLTPSESTAVSTDVSAAQSSVASAKDDMNIPEAQADVKDAQKDMQTAEEYALDENPTAAETSVGEAQTSMSDAKGEVTSGNKRAAQASMQTAAEELSSAAGTIDTSLSS